jgi:predicted nucleic acid-binding protein
MICESFVRLLGLQNVGVANAMKIHNALEWHQNGLDFADALHLASSSDCTRLATFDKAFISKSKHLAQCAVTLP